MGCNAIRKFPYREPLIITPATVESVSPESYNGTWSSLYIPRHRWSNLDVLANHSIASAVCGGQVTAGKDNNLPELFIRRSQGAGRKIQVN